MDNRKEKDTTVWKPKGDQKITRPSGPEPRRRKVRKSGHRNDRSSGFSAGRSAGYDAPSSGIGKLSLIIGAGAIIAALAKGVRASDYYKDRDEE